MSNIGINFALSPLQHSSLTFEIMKLADIRAQRIKDFRVSIAFLLVAVALIFSGWWAYHNFMVSPPFVDPERYPIRGIDISHHNGMMNLDAAAADGIEFAFIKASEGGRHRDPNFKINYEKARHAGLKTGAYHFFRFDTAGVEQARNFIAAIGDRKFELDPVIDVEEAGNPTTDPTIVQDRLKAMVEFLNLAGRHVIIYTNQEGFYKYVNDALPGATLWICSFNRIPFASEWTFWQYDHHGKVAGIRGDVDLNTFVGSREDWEKYLATGTL